MGASIALNIALLCALIWGEQGLVAYNGLRAELNALNAKAEAAAQKNLELSREIQLLESDEKYIEQMIRKRLNFIKENEVWYIFPAKKGAEGSDEPKN